MRYTPSSVWVALCLVATGQIAIEGAAYSDPGWNYIYDGASATNAAPGTGFLSLDGTWSHDNVSDDWDGSAPGEPFNSVNRPGGVAAITDGTLNYLRIQDSGDPRDLGFLDPGSNRRIYFGRSITEADATRNVLDEGITLSFRARIPTNAPVDPLHALGQTATQPYPAAGDGHIFSDSGRGNFVVSQPGGGSIGFSLTTTSDSPDGDPAGAVNFSGLTFNEYSGNFISDDVNFGQGAGTNRIALDPAQWHEFWIVLRKDPADLGTHEAFIYLDGSLSPRVFKVTSGTSFDFLNINYIAMGTPSSPQSSALDVDFFAYKLGAAPPAGAPALPPGNLPAEPVQLNQPTLSGSNLTLSFVAEGGRSYRIEYTESLSAVTWAALATLTNTGAGTTNVTDTVTNSSARFYRVVSQ